MSVVADPTGKFLYVVNATSGSATFTQGLVQAYSITPGTGALTPILTPVPTGGINSQDIALVSLPSGLFAYVTNLFNNTITQFAISGTGALTRVGLLPFPSGLSFTKGIVAHPIGDFIYAGAQATNSVGGYTVSRTGALGLPQHFPDCEASCCAASAAAG